MEDWSLVNAMELVRCGLVSSFRDAQVRLEQIMGRPGEPVELCLEREWTAAAEVERSRAMGQMTRQTGKEEKAAIALRGPHAGLSGQISDVQRLLTCEQALRRGLKIAAGDLQASTG
eukprot:747642-Hanusia_phi.AAC.9